MMRKFLLLLAVLAASVSLSAQTAQPKREFRGAWIQIINGQFQGMSRSAMQAELTRHLDAMQRCHINAVMFQVRGEADAFYASPYEPWSRFLTGTQGKAPNPYWDPLAWMVDECHRRGMELHAWINPFRAKTKGTTMLSQKHYVVQHGDRCFSYDGLMLLDPALPENRAYICRVAADIVRRYDVDGLHIDDYFYPYPVAGLPIPDDASFAKYNNGMTDRAEWRRQNVNRFIAQLHDSIHAAKPWVKFGISPFGIYHNQTNGTKVPGSATKGLQNYDDLYADILYWVNQGWVDYNVPQVYWEIGHAVAEHETLVRWWARHAANRPLFIGQDVERTARAADKTNPQQHQLGAKMQLVRSLPSVGGACWWYSAALARNEGNIANALAGHYYSRPALQPLMPFIDDKAPGKPRKVKALWMPEGYYLFWTAPKARTAMDEARTYAIYRFAKGEKINIDDASHLVATTDKTFYALPYEDGSQRYTYVVTALDRLSNESKPVKEKVKL